MNRIPGLNVRSYTTSNHRIVCKIDISSIDVDSLINNNLAGLPVNKELRELFIDEIIESLQTTRDNYVKDLNSHIT